MTAVDDKDGKLSASAKVRWHWAAQDKAKRARLMEGLATAGERKTAKKRQAGEVAP
ncbi:MAG TPA: hypothetical protein VFV95_19330 [Vicinamibacterales bacterium]|nr:hypothetical protein [Vicinamibacterales bacterium]